MSKGLTNGICKRVQSKSKRAMFVKIGAVRTVLAAALIGLTGIPAGAQQPPSSAAVHQDAIPAADLLQPPELVQILNSQAKPLVLQVGSKVLFEQAHIRGAEYAGAAGTAAGLETLRVRVAKLDKDASIVIYCGCCPWAKCPNIVAAYEQLHALGFTRVKALYIGQNFGADWVSKGYPIDGGLAAK